MWIPWVIGHSLAEFFSNSFNIPPPSKISKKFQIYFCTFVFLVISIKKNMHPEDSETQGECKRLTFGCRAFSLIFSLSACLCEDYVYCEINGDATVSTSENKFIPSLLSFCSTKNGVWFIHSEDWDLSRII